MNILFLERYNNYANRIVKLQNQYVEDYVAAQAADGKQTWLLENINFNPADGVDTSIIIGSTPSHTFPDWTPDYCIVYDPADKIHQEQLDQDFTPIKSSWFIIELDRTRGNQYSAALHRDVIKDNYDTVKEADVFVEKAILENDNPLIFNSEKQVYNQIKKSETLLKDPTGIQWLVGYCVQDHTTHSDLSATYTKPPGGSVIQISSLPQKVRNFFDTSAGAAGKNTTVLNDYDTNVEYHLYCTASKTLWTLFVPATNYCLIDIKKYGAWYASGTALDNNGYKPAFQFTGEQFMAYDINAWDKANWDGLSNVANNISSNRTYWMAQFRLENSITNYSDYMNLMNYNGKTLYDGQTGIFYKLKVTVNASSTTSVNYSFNTVSNVKARIRNAFVAYNGQGYNFDTSVSSGEKFFQLDVKSFVVNVVLEQQGSNTVKWSLPATRKQLSTEPYDMFCIPFGNFKTKNFWIEKEASTAAARAIAQAGIGTSNALVYDIQLLPYCPLQSTIRSNIIDESYLVEHEDYEYIYDPNNAKKSIVFFCSDHNFTFDIPLRIDSNDPKVDNECDLYRLCSPNYDGLFEFSVAKNRGITLINVDCSYKPFQPYIHLNPDFDELYGSDFNDARGLICGGEFSLAICTNAWEQYKLQNKNFQAMFDRGIQKMDQQAATDITLDTIRMIDESVYGSYKGFMSGGIPGAIFGGIHGGIQGAAKLAHTAATYGINRSYSVDMFNFQNGNIKALPNSLAKTDPFTNNNKKWPFLEYYTCTVEEREALQEKIRLNGMTVNVIGKLKDYTKPGTLRFFLGELIRDNYIMEDSHMVDAIYSELKKGVYL